MDFPVEYWEYDPESHREVIYKRIAKALAEREAELGRPLRTMKNNVSLEQFLDMYLVEANVDYSVKSAHNWSFSNIDHSMIGQDVLQDLNIKYDINENVEVTDKNSIPVGLQESWSVDQETENSQPSDGWSFKDFKEKYRPMAVLQHTNEEAPVKGWNVTHDKRLLSFPNNLDSTDELLSLQVPQSGRRWWNDQWQLGGGPKPFDKTVQADDIANSLLFMKQTIYQARAKMTLMQNMRKEFKTQALFKMGYLFAKTDYACKILSSLAFKSFRACSMIRQKIFGNYRKFHHYMDIAYNIERLEARWFDVDILKDLLITNDIIARKVILRDVNITKAAMAVKAFNKMFIN